MFSPKTNQVNKGRPFFVKFDTRRSSILQNVSNFKYQLVLEKHVTRAKLIDQFFFFFLLSVLMPIDS